MRSDNNEDRIEFPVYIGRTPPEYEWSLATVPQTHLDGKTRSIPMGRGVGGGSLVNGMIWNRGNQRDFDIWAQLGNPGWDWENLLPYFRKSETYTPVYYVTVAEDQGQGQQPVVFNPSVHGFSGPVNVSYPEYYWPQSSEYLPKSPLSMVLFLEVFSAPWRTLANERSGPVRQAIGSTPSASST